MAKLAILKDGIEPFEGDQYIVDTYRNYTGWEEGKPIHQKGDLVCYCTPFFGIPLKLEIAIRVDGQLIFRKWDFTSSGQNSYLHTHEKPEGECGEFERPFIPTEQQKDTVAGLFSGRIKFEGLKLAVGRTVQNVCPIDIEREQKLIGKKIYLA